MRKFQIGDIVINKDETSSGYGTYGKVSSLWGGEGNEYGVTYYDQGGIRKKFYEWRLELKQRKVVQICGLAKFCAEHYK